MWISFYDTDDKQYICIALREMKLVNWAESNCLRRPQGAKKITEDVWRMRKQAHNFVPLRDQEQSHLLEKCRQYHDRKK